MKHLGGTLLLLWLVASAFSTGPFSVDRIVVFGDSLSDTGNFFLATGQPGPPYYMGRSSNGPLAVENLAAIYGVSLDNFSWFGATSGVGNNQDGGTQETLGSLGLPGVRTAYEAAKLSGDLQVDSKTLFVVWAGPNDFVSDEPTIATVLTAVKNIVYIVEDLQDQGAKRILVPGIPDLGLTPLVRAEGPLVAARVSLLSEAFNVLLLASLPRGVHYFDTAGAIRHIVADPMPLGFTNVTDPCFIATVPSLCGNPDQYLFWDLVHPTARVHEIVGELFGRCANSRTGLFVRHCRVALGKSLRKELFHTRNATGRHSALVLPGSR